MRSDRERGLERRPRARIVVVMANGDQRTQSERPMRRPRRFGQPESTAALRPSQRRAERNRAAAREQQSAEDWLRRLARR